MARPKKAAGDTTKGSKYHGPPMSKYKKERKRKKQEIVSKYRKAKNTILQAAAKRKAAKKAKMDKLASKKVPQPKLKRTKSKLASPKKVAVPSVKPTVKEGTKKLTRRGRQKAIGASKGTKVSKGATKLVETKGGEYVKYKKDSKPAKSFRSTFKSKCSGKGAKDTFTWQGRKYSCARK